jgi:hypothetical protein
MLDIPSFPKAAPLRNSRDAIDLGVGGGRNWETTYGSGNQPRTLSSDDAPVQTFDTAAHQQTHWTSGDQPEPLVTDYQREYIAHPLPPKPPGRSRDELMATSFSLGDNNLIDYSRPPPPPKAIRVPPADLGGDLRSTHLNLHMGAPDEWTTTHQSSFALRQSVPPILRDGRVNEGKGAGEAMRWGGGSDLGASEMRSSFVKFTKPDPTIIPDRRYSTLAIGDPRQTTYETTHSAAYKRLQMPSTDPRETARLARLALQRSRVTEGNREPVPQRSSYADTFVEYKEPRRQPADLVPTASHLPAGDGSPDQWRSCAQEAYQPLKGERTEVVDRDLRGTHIRLGADGVRETTSLYTDTFKGTQGRLERVDATGMRDFHTAHHTKVGGREEQGPMISTSKDSFLPHTEAATRAPITFDHIEHVIIPGDPSHTVRESSMKGDFVPHSYLPPPKQINNSLQESHITATSGAADNWTTTQQDYFQFRTYKFD